MTLKLTPKDVAGAVDIKAIDCRGCRYKSMTDCKRFPPVWVTPIPILEKGKAVGMQQGSWAFPPAKLKCGEFETAELG